MIQIVFIYMLGSRGDPDVARSFGIRDLITFSGLSHMFGIQDFRLNHMFRI